MTAQLVIENRRKALIELPDLPALAGTGDTPDRPAYSPYRLSPGENNVPEDYWRGVVGNPAVKQYIACKALVNRGEGAAKKLVDSISGLQPEEAMRNIAKCTNVELLGRWRDSTDSSAYQAAIQDRIGVLVENASGEVEGEE